MSLELIVVVARAQVQLLLHVSNVVECIMVFVTFLQELVSALRSLDI